MDKKYINLMRKKGHILVEDDFEGMKEDDFENVNIFAYEVGNVHNGPACSVCGWGQCWHCDYLGKNIPKCTGKTNV